MSVPTLRIGAMNAAPIRAEGDSVVYWMIANRRGTWNFALQRAVEWARDLKKPLVILEALRASYHWASDRLHRFVLDGMADNRRHFADRRKSGVRYYPYVEPRPGAGAELLKSLAERACVVVTDDFPCFFLPRMVAAAARRLNVRLEAVDANGLLPLRAADRTFTMAFHFRRWLQKHLPPHLADEQLPDADPLKRVVLPRARLPADVLRRWPEADLDALRQGAAGLADLPINHRVAISPIPGGSAAGEQRWTEFLQHRLAEYGQGRNQPDEDAASGLSPYLHFGHIAAHQIYAQAVARESWDATRIAKRSDGKAAGWWGLSAPLESFLDQLVTWRELGFNFCSQRDDFDQYESLPEWARATLAKHAADRRPHVYTLGEFERAETHDPLWNAAQRQLLREGKIHNYLRMLWGKKIMEWSPCPRDALAVMIELNNKYALDGRDPNSYSGIFWCLGRYDRPWAPQRPIFGSVRYMSSENTARKLRVKRYLQDYGPASGR